MSLKILPGFSQKNENHNTPYFHDEKNLDKKSYFLANSKAFFHRYLDTGFKNKWTGLWQGNTKFLEFFTVKTFGEYLGESNALSSFYDYAITVHTHKIGKLEIDQMVWMPDDKSSLVVEFLSEKELELEFELAVNIREREENSHDRTYRVDDSNCLTISSDLGNLLFTPLNGEFEFTRNEQYLEHFPSGEKQNYFLPGKITISGNNPAFSISLNHTQTIKETDLEHKDNHYHNLTNVIKSDNDKIELWFKQSILALELLKNEKGYYAGLPWFTQNWGRDTFWTLPALLNLGYFNRAKDVLLNFANRAEKGKIPNFFNEKELNTNSIDATLLYLISLEKYLQYTSDKSILKQLLPFIVNTISFLDSRDVDKDGLIEHDHDKSETWMDTLRRPDKAIEISALYYAAVHSLKHILGDYLGKKETISKQLDHQLRRIRADFPHLYRTKEGYYADRIQNYQKIGTLTPNYLVPHLLGLLKSHKDLDLFWSERFMTKKGITSLAKDDLAFNPEAYHQGIVWSLTLAWLSMAEFKSGRPSRGYKALKQLCDNFSIEGIGCIGETWYPNSLDPQGCLNQLWGSAMPIRIIDEFIIGIKADAINSTLYIKPQFPGKTKRIERKIKLNGETAWIKIEKIANNHYTVSSDNKNVKVELQ